MRAEPHRTLTPLATALLPLLRARPMHPYGMHQAIRDRDTDHATTFRACSLGHTVQHPHREPATAGRLLDLRAIALEAE